MLKRLLAVLVLFTSAGILADEGTSVLTRTMPAPVGPTALTPVGQSGFTLTTHISRGSYSDQGVACNLVQDGSYYFPDPDHVPPPRQYARDISDGTSGTFTVNSNNLGTRFPPTYTKIVTTYNASFEESPTGSWQYNITWNSSESVNAYPVCGEEPPPEVEPYVEVCALKDIGSSVLLDDEWIAYAISLNLYSTLEDTILNYNLVDVFDIPVAERSSAGCKKFSAEDSEWIYLDGALIGSRVVPLDSDADPTELVRDFRVRIRWVDENTDPTTYEILANRGMLLSYTSATNAPWAGIPLHGTSNDFVAVIDIYDDPSRVPGQRWIMFTPSGGFFRFLDEFELLEEI